MKNITLCCYLLLVFCLFSCNSKTVTDTNDPEDLKQAEKLTNSYYEKVKNKDFSAICNELSPDTKPQEMLKVLNSMDSLCGKYLSHKIIRTNTIKTNINNSEKTEYGIRSEVKYEKEKIQEDLFFKKDSTGKTYLFHYEVNEK